MAPRAAVDDPPTVDQRQGPVDAEASQIDLRRAVAVAGPIGVGLIAGSPCGRRQSLQQRLHVRDPRTLDILACDDRGGTDPADVLALDPAARDDDFADVGRLGFLRECGHSAHGGGDYRTCEQEPLFHAVHGHSPRVSAQTNRSCIATFRLGVRGVKSCIYI